MIVMGHWERVKGASEWASFETTNFSTRKAWHLSIMEVHGHGCRYLGACILYMIAVFCFMFVTMLL